MVAESPAFICAFFPCVVFFHFIQTVCWQKHLFVSLGLDVACFVLYSTIACACCNLKILKIDMSVNTLKVFVVRCLVFVARRCCIIIMI